MRHTSIRNHIFVLFLFLCLGAFVVYLATAQTQPDPTTIRLHTGTDAEINNLSQAHTWWNTTTGYLRDRNNEIQDLEIDLKILNYALSDAWDTLLNEVISGTGAGADLSVGSALASSLIQMRKNNQISDIKKKRVRKYAEIAAKQTDVNNYASDRDRVYAVFEAWWEYTYSGSNTVPEKSPPPKTVSVPSSLTLECDNECGTTFSGSSSAAETLITEATSKHKKTCNETPHKDYEYWTCPDGSGSCDKFYEHYLSCVGSCGQKGPQEWKYAGDLWPGQVYSGKAKYDLQKKQGGFSNLLSWTQLTIFSHKTSCTQTARKLLGTGPCGEKYYQCRSSNTCPKADNHVSGDDTSPPPADPPPSENPVVSPPPTPTPTPPPSPTYHACGVHETSVSGDHSLQASCTSTDSNGNTCTVTSFYACASHTHSYPTPPPTPTPTPTPPPEPTPTPPAPTTVACGARGWTGCSIRSSDGNVCLVDPCDSGCGSYYWSCASGGVSWHKTSRTCKRSNCGASYTNCTRGDGTCSGGKYTWHKK